jgi:hypothetical protein
VPHPVFFEPSARRQNALSVTQEFEVADFMPGNLYRRPQAFGLCNSPLGNAVRQRRAEPTSSAAQLPFLPTTASITGLWQVIARTNPSFDACMTLDLEYMKRWSLFLDFEILMRTVPTVLAGKGS